MRPDRGSEAEAPPGTLSAPHTRLPIETGHTVERTPPLNKPLSRE